MKLAIVLTAMLTASAAQAHEWQVHVNNISRGTYVWVRVNGVLAGECRQGGDCTFPLVNGLQHGKYNPTGSPGIVPTYENILDVMVISKGNDWTYGYEVIKDGATIVRSSCGKADVSNCPFGRPDPTQIAVVHQAAFTFPE